MDTRDLPTRFALRPHEAGEVDVLLEQLAGEDPGAEPFYARAWELTDSLPVRLRRFLHTFRSTEPAGCALITGLSVDDAAVGPTPVNWRAAGARREELYLGLLAMVLGEPFTWSTLQHGRMIQNIVPVEGEAARQSGHGQVLLEWHTEDAFHPNRCDYLLLLGVRNHDGVATTTASIRDVTLDPEQRAVLAEPRFQIRPDDEHLRQLAGVEPASPGLAQMRRMAEDPQAVAVLFGAPDDPYLRIDPYFMTAVPGDAEARTALKALVAGLNDALHRVVVRPGSVLIVDNHRAVHGRESFTARFDGTDRWLKKIIVTRDLRRSRELRAAPDCRVIG
ncbi:TauD/TfdA family dioxygenase [Dactylosporangium vinaceum]|uniref:Guanitoxin biosynthesis L-enduracididine beta-hydroxylase GntD n=1 Tax=Dactylosporangium vinaceum TaxID=53362 RepID=A0ABV5MS89_9ACTN|nr:guanitoxin biosynthesis L-enduracididine beta-hydroxylase GntD [Dactylosporangium vinaceum]UAC00211.1 TauD/TfdA family dioxygenase [Dactylosporangium vinaceum]